jgi:hypothetical protein
MLRCVRQLQNNYISCCDFLRNENKKGISQKIAPTSKEYFQSKTFNKDYKASSPSK